MAPLVLDGNTLGEKHKNYNQLLKNALESDKTTDPANLNSGQNELDTLLKIDIASKDRNVDYILEVLKCEDMLYVCYTLKRCVWLVTDPQYAHIINPDYLRTNLFPQMTAKASTKLWNQIRQHLKDEKRVEEFYLKENDKNAMKWLPHCSPSFIEANISKHKDTLKNRLAKRILEKSTNAVSEIKKDDDCYDINLRNSLAKASFLINENPEKYLDLIESMKNEYNRPRFGKRATARLMKKFSDRIINKFEIYGVCVHVPTFVKFLHGTNLEQFLFKLASDDNSRLLHSFDSLKLIINSLPDENRFEFVKKIFIKIEIPMSDENVHKKLLLAVNHIPSYRYYEFAPFDIAFEELFKLYEGEEKKNKREKKGILSTLIACAKKDMRNLSRLIKHYRDNYSKADRKLKTHFVETIISESNFYRFDETTWSILDNLYKDIDVYTESECTNNVIIESIIVYNILHDTTVPDVIKKKFAFGSLKQYQTKLKDEEKQKLFSYLYNLKSSELKLQSISTENDFEKAVGMLDEIMTLVGDWKKELTDFPEILENVKSFLQVKRKNSWKTNMKSLYCNKKSWKKNFFNESFEMFPSEDVSLNALKHNSQLLVENKHQLDTLNIPLYNVLNKLRLYWSESLCKQWIESYISKLNDTESHKVLIRGLCVLLSRQPLLDMIEKNAPKQAEIDWNNINEMELSLQRYLAKNMHFARPQPPPQAILPYARGDYLQYALPSLLAIFYNMKLSLTREFIPQLLNAPVSLQKHGIRIVFQKLSTDDLLENFPNLWKISKNATIRAVPFCYTYEMLCKEEDASKKQKIWQLMKQFIDNFTFEEDKKVFELLKVESVQKVPLDIRPEYFVKSYNYMKVLIPHLLKSDQSNFEYNFRELTNYTRDLIQSLPEDFVVGILSEFLEDKFIKTRIDDGILNILSAYLLSAPTEEIQMERYKTVLLPLINRSLSEWNQIDDKDSSVKLNFARFLSTLRRNLEYVCKNKFIVPVKLYNCIFEELNKLPVAENYMLLTKWKITLELTKNFNTQTSAISSGSSMEVVCEKVADEFGKACLRFLKEDVNQYFPDIYLLFAKCLQTLMEDYPKNAKTAVYKGLISDVECKEAYLVVILLCPDYIYDDKEKVMMQEIKKLLLAHPSVEVKMHWYHKFKKSN